MKQFTLDPAIPLEEGGSFHGHHADLKLVFPDSPLDQASILPQTISVLPSATLKILMIKLTKAARSALAAGAFHLELQSGKLGDDDMNTKLSDLGLRAGDEVIVRTE